MDSRDIFRDPQRWEARCHVLSSAGYFWKVQASLLPDRLEQTPPQASALGWGQMRGKKQNGGDISRRQQELVQRGRGEAEWSRQAGARSTQALSEPPEDPIPCPRRSTHPCHTPVVLSAAGHPLCPQQPGHNCSSLRALVWGGSAQPTKDQARRTVTHQTPRASPNPHRHSGSCCQHLAGQGCSLSPQP